MGTVEFTLRHLKAMRTSSDDGNAQLGKLVAALESMEGDLRCRLDAGERLNAQARAEYARRVGWSEAELRELLLMLYYHHHVLEQFRAGDEEVHLVEVELATPDGWKDTVWSGTIDDSSMLAWERSFEWD